MAYATAVIGLVGVAGSAAAPAAIGAQETRVPARTDARLMPFLGCWRATEVGAPSPGLRLTCVVPASNASAVRVLDIDGDAVSERMVLDISGATQRRQDGGCDVEASGRLAADGPRAYVSQGVTCGGRTMRGTAVFDLLSATSFIEVRALQKADGAVPSEPRVTQYDALATPNLSDAARAAVGDIAALTPRQRELYVSPVTLPQIAEVSSAVNEPVARGWLTLRGSNATVAVTAKSLRQLRDAGVPGSVTDVLVALAYPRVFRLASSGEAEQTNPDSLEQRMRRDRARMAAAWCMGGPMMCPWQWDPFFANSMWGMPWGNVGYGGWWNGFGAGWGPFGNGWVGNGWNGWAGWGWGGRFNGGFVPIYVGNQPPPSTATVDRRRGYSSGNQSGGGTASGGSVSASGGASRGSSGSSSGNSGGNSSSGRTAVRKP
jgi:hypothetical protein